MPGKAKNNVICEEIVQGTVALTSLSCGRESRELSLSKQKLAVIEVKWKESAMCRCVRFL